MNLNDFVVLPNNKAKSVKLNARNLQELQMETVTLAQESKEMEEKLQQLKKSMSKEKEERGHSGGCRWKSGQCGSLNTNALMNSTKKNKEKGLQKLSTGKVKIRVLKDQPLTAPPQPTPPAPPPPAAVSLLASRKNRLRGTNCGQCEVKTAGLMCAECSEDYCVGCFAKFHQKGALKLHKMIPIQTRLQTHVSTQDVVSCFQKQINPNHTIKSNTITRQGGAEAVTKPMEVHHDPSQGLAVNCGEERKVGMIEEGLTREDERGFHTTLLSGEYDEEESARAFQEVVRQWRGEKSNGVRGSMSEDAMWTPVRPVSVSAMATQADLPPDRGAQRRGGGEGRVPVRVEFTENSLTYVDRLLLKKHRRTPVETYPVLAFGTDYKNSIPNTNTQEETSNGLTAQEEDFRRYCASLFAVPVSSGRTEPQITTPESCLTIEVLDEKDTGGDFVAEHRTENKTMVPSVQQGLSKGRTLVSQTDITGDVPSGVLKCSSPSATQPSRQSRAPAQPTAVLKHHISKPQTSQAEHSMKSSPSKSKPSACTTASKTPRTSKASIKIPNSALRKPNFSPTVHKSKPDCGSPRLSFSLPKSSHTALSFTPNVSAMISRRPPITSPSVDYSLRSTFIVSPLSSTESTLLPKVYQSTSFQQRPDSSPLAEQPQSSQLFPEPISPFKLSQFSPSNLESSRQSQHSHCDPDSWLSDNQHQLPLSPLSLSPNLTPKSLEPSTPPKSLPEFPNGSPPDSRHRLTPKQENVPFFISSSPIPGDHESTLSLQDVDSISSLSSHLLNVIQNTPLAVKIEDEEELSRDSGDEMSSDSLGPHEDDSSDEEAQMHEHLTRTTSREEEQGHPDMSHLEDPFVPTFAEGERHLQTDEQEQLSKPSMVVYKQSAGSGSEHFYDVDGFLPLGLDTISGHSDTPEHTHCNPLLTSRSLSCGSDPTGSEGFWPSSSLSSYTEEHLVFGMVKDNHTQPYGIQIHSTTPTSRGEISANERGTSGSRSNQCGKSTPTLSVVPAARCLSRPKLGSELSSVSRSLSQAAQEIMEICNVDQAGCEDPDLDTDTTTHTLQELEQELRLMTKETETHAPVFGEGRSGSQVQGGDHHFMRGRVREEQKDEDVAAQTDQQSVL